MSQPHKSFISYTTALANNEHLSWFPPAPPACFVPAHLNPQLYRPRGTAPLDLSYQHEHPHSAPADLLFAHKPCNNQDMNSPGKLTYYDMDTRQSHLVSATSYHLPGITRGPAGISRGLPGIERAHSGITKGPDGIPRGIEKGLPGITSGKLGVARGPPDIMRSPRQMLLTTSQPQPAAAHQHSVSIASQQSMVRTPSKTPDSTGEISLVYPARNTDEPSMRRFAPSSPVFHSQPACPSQAHSMPILTSPREVSNYTTSPLGREDNHSSLKLFSSSDQDHDGPGGVLEKPLPDDDGNDDTSCGQVNKFPRPTSSRSRSRRPVERYQVIHDYRGKKNTAIDLISRRQSADKQAKNFSKPKVFSNMADSWSSTRKHCDDSSNRTCNVNKPAEDSLNETLMVPDSTTELLSISSPSSPLDLNLMIAEQPHKSISLSADGMTKDNLSKKTLSQLPLGEASFTSPVMLSPLNLHCRPAQTSPISPNEQRRPSQTSPNLYRALTRKLPPPDDSIKTLKHPEEKLTSVDTSMDSLSEVHIVEQACEENESESEKFREAFPASSAVSKLSVEDSKVEQKPKSQECSLAPLSPCESPPEPPREADTAIISRRRRVCQTDFFRVVYPEPKRKKCVDPGRPVLKTKTSKEQRVTTPAQLKLCKDKTNVPAVDILKPSADSAQNLKALANSSQSSAGLDEKSPKNQEEKMDGKTVGRIVWAKLTARSKAWPAVTIKNTLAAQSPASADSQWVFWYGEHKVSEVQINRLHDFDVGFKNSFKSNSGSVYQSAVIEALRDCWTQLNTNNDRPSAETMPDGLEALVEWADERFCSDVSILSNGEVPKEVGERLVEIVAMINEAEDSADESDDGTDQDYRIKQRNLTPKSKKEAAERKVALVSRATMMAQVKSEGIDLESVCLSCGNQVSSSQNEHPLFRGGVCKACMYHVKDSFFSFGSDGCMSYCVICGHGGELLVCDSQTCGRTYCNECIEVLGSEQLLEDVKESDPWACFVCKPMSREGVLIHRRDDWKQRLMKFYQKPSKLHNLPECKPDRKLRVISLFDGIGTAKVVLDNLNLDVEVYYSLEIEEDAIQVVNLNHGDSIIQLGDIREFTEEKLASLGRIDLLVGGSPCNDLALVNPARKGLYDATGTGILFFDFYRVLMTLMSRQPNHSVLWLFENVVHMNKETKEAISRFLECEPVKLDAGVFSAQSRARYFWGNIPGMFCPISPEMSSANIRLQDVLSKGREAAVSKIRTVTTRGASLLQGKNEDTHAVVMNGQSDKLWPTELEKVFGLPVHYTDAGNLAPGKRQKLLGRSWCVPVIEHLLKPLTHLFAVKPDKSNKESCTCGKK